MTKISQPGISRLENGRYTPSSPLVVVLAKALKISTDELLGIRNTATALQTGKIKICDCCASSLAEFSAYRWNEKSGNDAPIKENDHAMDDIRYFVNTVLYNKGGFFVDVR